MGTDFSSPLARSNTNIFQFAPFQNSGLFDSQRSSQKTNPQETGVDNSLFVDIGRISLDSSSHQINGLKSNPTSEQNLNPYSLNYTA